MALTSEEIKTIFNETLDGRPSSVKGKEAADFRAELMEEFEYCRNAGLVPELPDEIPEVESDE